MDTNVIEYIPVEECEDERYYILDARNLWSGIYNEKKKVFTGIRYKFNDQFLAEETHWDTDNHYGTARPLRTLEFFCNEKDDELFRWLLRKDVEIFTLIKEDYIRRIEDLNHFISGRKDLLRK